MAVGSYSMGHSLVGMTLVRNKHLHKLHVSSAKVIVDIRQLAEPGEQWEA